MFYGLHLDWGDALRSEPVTECRPGGLGRSGWWFAALTTDIGTHTGDTPSTVRRTRRWPLVVVGVVVGWQLTPADTTELTDYVDGSAGEFYEVVHCSGAVCDRMKETVSRIDERAANSARAVQYIALDVR